MPSLPRPETVLGGRKLPKTQRAFVPVPVVDSGLTQVARGLGRIADARARQEEIKQEKTARTWVARTTAEARAKWLQESVDRQQNTSDPANYARGFNSDFTKYAEATLANAPTPEAREALDIRLIDLGGQFNADALKFENGLYTANAKRDIDTSYETGVNTLLSHPDQFQGVAADHRDMIEANKGFLGDQGARDRARDANAGLTAAMLAGRLAQGDVDGVASELSAGRYDASLAPRAKASLLGDIERKRIDVAKEAMYGVYEGGDGFAIMDAVRDPEIGGRLSPKTRRVYQNQGERMAGDQAYEAASNQIAGGQAVRAGVFTQELDGAIGIAATTHGVDATALTTIAMLESNGRVNARNKSTGASGAFQFMPATAREFGVENPNDPLQAATGAARLYKRNAEVLAERLGRDPEPWEGYLAHQQGAGGASALLSAESGSLAVDVLAGVYGNRATAERAVTLNGGHAAMSAAEFAGVWQEKYEAAEARVSASSDGAVRGAEYMTSTQVKALQKQQAEVLEQASIVARVNLAEAGNAPFDNGNKSDRDIRDDLWSQYAMAVAIPEDDVPAITSAALAFTQRYGSAPKPVLDRLKQGMLADDPSVSAEAVQGAYSLAQEDPFVWDRIGGDHEAYASLVTSLARNGFQPGAAAEMARAAVFEVEPAVREAREARLKEDGDKGLQVNALEFAVDQFGVEEGTADADRLQSAFLPAYKAAFVATGDDEAAKTLSIERMKRTWGRSDLLGGKLMRHPPEVAFGVLGNASDRSANTDWQREDLAGDLAPMLGLKLRASEGAADDSVAEYRDKQSAMYSRYGSQTSEAVRKRRQQSEDTVSAGEVLDKVHLEPVVGQNGRVLGYQVFTIGEYGIREPLYDFTGNSDMGAEDVDGSIVIWRPEYNRSPHAARERTKRDEAVAEARQAHADHLATHKKRQQTQETIQEGYRTRSAKSSLPGPTTLPEPE